MAAPELAPWINSAGEDGDRNSMQQFDGTGSQKSFDFNFAGGYIFATDVKAYLYDLASGLTTAVDTIVLTGPNTIFVDPAPAAVNLERTVGEVLVVYRDTQKTTPLVDYTTGAVLNEQNLDMSNRQAVFVAAEMVDRFDSINASSADAIERSFEALTKAEDALDASAAAVTASNNAVTTANQAAVDAANALDIAEDAVAAATGFQTDQQFYEPNDATQRGAVWQLGTIALPGNKRWFAGVDAGSDYTLQRYNDAGVLQGAALKVARASGLITVTNRITGLSDGTGATDATTKGQMDTAVATRLTVASNLGDVPDKAAARGNLAVLSDTQSRDLVRGRTGFMSLWGVTASGTSLALNAERVFLADASGNLVSVSSGVDITCTFTATGVNGRESAANFQNAWGYVHYIWNGATLGLLLSASRTAPTLPGGYTHWAFAVPVRFGATANNVLLGLSLRKSTVSYTADTAILTSGTLGSVAEPGNALTSTRLYLPPLKLQARLRGTFQAITDGSGAGQAFIYLTPFTGAARYVSWSMREVYTTSGVNAGYPYVYGDMPVEPTTDIRMAVTGLLGTVDLTISISSYEFSNGAV